MSPLDLLALYLAVGAAIAAMVLRRASGPRSVRLASALAAWILWPLWAPIALGPDRTPRRVARTPALDRLHATLDETLGAAAGTPFSALLGHDAAARIRREIERAAARSAELEAALSRPGCDPRQANSRVAELEARGASSRALQTARLHKDGLERLARLRDADRRMLEEMGDALEALRSQIVLARACAPGSSDIVSELWARVEGLGSALDDRASLEDRGSLEDRAVQDDRPGPEEEGMEART